jgi:hypothetical protein
MSKDKTGAIGRFWQPAIALSCLLVAALVVAACSSGSSGTSGSSMGTVSVMLSDPATCTAPNGPYTSVWVTISDVQVNTSASAGASDAGWVDLTPNLKGTPKQVNLLAQANNQCFLASLGDNLQLQAGQYQQIRLILATDTTGLTMNNCQNGTGANCVETSDGKWHALKLASEDQTGIKIPSGQIASGAFNISSGQTKDLDIDFNTCESIVQAGNSGNYILKPVLHAGEVSTTSSSINGTVMSNATDTVFVALEQPDINGVDRVKMQTQAASDGTFVFCPLPAGTYDVVIVGTTASGELYQPSIVTGVSVGSTVGSVKLNLPPTSPTDLTALSKANLTGTVTTAGTSGAQSAMVTLSVLETVNSKVYTIPMQPPSNATAPYIPYFQSTFVATTAVQTNPACTSGTDCYYYSLPVSSGGAYIGAWAAGGTTLSPASMTTSLAAYEVDGTTTTCTDVEKTTTPAVQLTAAGLTTSTNVAITPDLAFTGCS